MPPPSAPGYGTGLCRGQAFRFLSAPREIRLRQVRDVREGQNGNDAKDFRRAQIRLREPREGAGRFVMVDPHGHDRR
jgi:hypothetical protein